MKSLDKVLTKMACFQNLMSCLAKNLKNMDEDVAITKLILSLQNSASNKPFKVRTRLILQG